MAKSSHELARVRLSASIARYVYLNRAFYRHLFDVRHLSSIYKVMFGLFSFVMGTSDMRSVSVESIK